MELINQTNKSRFAAIFAAFVVQKNLYAKIKAEVAKLREDFDNAEVDTNAALDAYLSSIEADLAAIESASAEVDSINPDEEPAPEPAPEPEPQPEG